jgi:hypothetical protein
MLKTYAKVGHECNARLLLTGPALRGVEANVRSLRHYAIEFQKSKNAIDEFEILSQTITGSFIGFHEDVVVLKQILPPRPSQALAVKLKWVYNGGRIRALTKRLQERQIGLVTALAITGRYARAFLPLGSELT